MNAALEIICKVCGASIPLENIDTSTKMARCEFCSTVYDMTPRLGGATSPGRPEVPLPAKFNVENAERGLEISWRWFSPRYLIMIFFCVFWMGFLGFWYAGGIAARGSAVVFLMPVIHVGVGVWLCYTALAGVLNSTKLTLGRGQFTIKHGPVPWRGNMTVQRGDLDQLYCKEKIKRSRNGTSHTFEVHAVLANGRNKKILARLQSADQAMWIEQEIERKLGIEDRAVGGELPR